MKCPHCSKDIDPATIAAHLGALGGGAATEKQKAASRINGMKGGRPKNKPKEKEKADNEND
jgi:hypothetical protein